MAQTSLNGDEDTRAEEAVERQPTERVILERIRALRVPDDVTDEQLAEALKALTKGKRRLVIEVGWVEVSRQIGSSKKGAIEAYAGKAGTADAKVGVFRAPSVTAWKGALSFEAPAKPLVQARLIDD